MIRSTVDRVGDYGFKILTRCDMWKFNSMDQRAMSSKGFQFKYLYNSYYDLCETEDQVEICMDGEIDSCLSATW